MSEEVYELRVPGVGGPSPAKVLGRPELVYGDRSLGVYRRSRESEGNIDVFLWGGLNRRVFAVLRPVLLPFALSNVAGWMAPPRQPGRRHLRLPYQPLAPSFLR